MGFSPLDLDDEFVNYDSDYEVQDDTPNAQVDIDPYAGSFTTRRWLTPRAQAS
jgi:hypothetical protein